METNSERELKEFICIRCGHSNPEGASRCSNCSSPLDDFASSSPWEMGTATSAAYSPAVNPRTKPIVFWGVLLYFGPSAIWFLWYMYSFIQEYFTDENEAPPIGETILDLTLPVLYGILSIWVLCTVTRSYLCKK